MIVFASWQFPHKLNLNLIYLSCTTSERKIYFQDYQIQWCCILQHNKHAYKKTKVVCFFFPNLCLCVLSGSILIKLFILSIAALQTHLLSDCGGSQVWTCVLWNVHCWDSSLLKRIVLLSGLHRGAVELIFLELKGDTQALATQQPMQQNQSLNSLHNLDSLQKAIPF